MPVVTQNARTSVPNRSEKAPSSRGSTRRRHRRCRAGWRRRSPPAPWGAPARHCRRRSASVAPNGDRCRHSVNASEMVLPVRIELTTSALPRMRSTTELRQHFVRRGRAYGGGPARASTRLQAPGARGMWRDGRERQGAGGAARGGASGEPEATQGAGPGDCEPAKRRGETTSLASRSRIFFSPSALSIPPATASPSQMTAPRRMMPRTS